MVFFINIQRIGNIAAETAIIIMATIICSKLGMARPKKKPNSKPVDTHKIDERKETQINCFILIRKTPAKNGAIVRTEGINLANIKVNIPYFL